MPKGCVVERLDKTVRTNWHFFCVDELLYSTIENVVKLRPLMVCLNFASFRKQRYVVFLSKLRLPKVRLDKFI